MTAYATICTLGIDVGGTKIAGGVLSLPEGRPLVSEIVPTGAHRGGQAVLDDVLDLAGRLHAKAASSSLAVAAVGLGVCELVDREGRIVSENCLRWRSLPVREELSAFGPTVIEADVRAAAIAESRWGAGRERRSFLYVTVGTGIACCLMLDGRPFLGTRGITGTMGSSPLSVPCEKCGHVSRRTLEELSAGPALVQRFNAMHGQAETGHDVLSAAQAGNAVATRIVQSAGEALESQIGLLVNVLDPEAVIIGGGLGLSGGPYWDHFIASTRRHIWSELHRGLPILRAATGSDAGWIGAATQAWQIFSAHA